jgi:hypothetical protein
MELQGNDKEICQKENDRIYNTGQKVDQISLFKASISITDCNNLVDDAKAACEKSNTFSREFVKALDKLKLEDCTTYTTRDEQNICDGRNKDAIYLAKVKTDLGVDDCSNLSGSEKTNCDFKNYYLNKTANILANYFPEDCSKYQTASEIAACDENNKQTYKNAFNLTPFVGSVEMGASCVYTETCTEGGKKACAGKVANDNGAPVCRYDPGVASCSACSTGELDLAAVAKQAAEQAAANAPIDPAKYFSQKFEEGVACKQVQSCGDGQEQVCEGKGSNGACDLSQGGGICSPCQAKGTITLNRVASCNAQNKCEGAPALSGCMNDDQCKPPPPPPPAA